MALIGKFIGQTAIKSDGDVFHEIFCYRPHHVPGMSPDLVQGCDIHEGEWGTVGSIIFWNYVLDGKAGVAKELVQAIDEEKKSITLKVIEGDLLELYKTFIVTIHVDIKGAENIVTWTIDYEKLSESVADPNTVMEFFLKLTKDIEAHHLKH